MLYSKAMFQPKTPDEAFDLVDEATLGTLVTAAPQGLQISHPVFMSDRARNRLVSHLARANDHAPIVESGAPSTAILMDPGAYLSSSWHPGAPLRDSAPTWAFRVAHFHGRLEVLSEAATARHLAALAAHLEKGRPGAWRMGELGPGGLERRLPRILGFELVVEKIEVSFRLGQDERPQDMAGVAAGLRAEGRALLADRIAAACGLNDEAPDPLAPEGGGSSSAA